MRQQIRLEERNIELLKYPVLNIYTSPRVANTRIDHKSTPMSVYTGPIEANNVTKYFDQSKVEQIYLRKLEEPHGLIQHFAQMKAYRFPQDQSKTLGVKILICVCMYNESKNAINLTLGGIYKNLEHLEKQGFSSEEIGVVLIQDGILKLVADRKARTYAKGKNSMVEFVKELDRNSGKQKCDLEERINIILEQIENFDKKGMGSQVSNNKDFPPTIEKNISLLYQNLWDPGMTDPISRLKARLGQEYSKKLKIFLCFKHLNGTKLSSHLWFFEGFCRYLSPQFIVLLDVGTQPDEKGVVNLIKGFYQKEGKVDENVGGTTGLMSVDSNFPSEEGGDGVKQETENCISRTFFSIQKAQEYEYIISHFIDKNAESALGFLHVLPGAWSAYRYKALIKSEEYEPNLLEHSYFKMTLNPDLGVSGYQQANMYLAEDRILSLGIYCQPKSKFYLRYIPDAGARTDPMKSHEDLMKQRRRWINSSLFAFLYVFKNYSYNAGQSNHGPLDKYFALNCSMLIALLSFATSYFIPSLYFYVLYAIIIQIDIQSTLVQVLAKVAALVYIITYLIAIAGGLSGSVWTKYAQNLSRVFALMNYLVLGLVVYNILNIYLGINSTGIQWNNFTQVSVVVMLFINIGGYLLVILMHLPTHCRQVGRLFLDLFSYWYYQGAYTQTLVAHAFCNVDDVSWGTKGSTSKHGGKEYDTDKVFFVSNWVFWNCILAYVCIYVDIVISQGDLGPEGNRKKVLLGIAIFGSAQLLLKIILAVINHIRFLFSCSKFQMQPTRLQAVKKFWSDKNQVWLKQIQKKVLDQRMPVSRIVRRNR